LPALIGGNLGHLRTIFVILRIAGFPEYPPRVSISPALPWALASLRQAQDRLGASYPLGHAVGYLLSQN